MEKFTVSSTHLPLAFTFVSTLGEYAVGFLVCSTSDLSILPQLDQLIYFEAETVTDSEIIYHA